MKKIALFVTAVLAFTSQSLAARDYIASEFGIKSNGSTMNTSSIQAAIDRISAEGGGTLYFKVGRYLTGTIFLKDNVTINLGEGAVLLGSTNPYDYPLVNGSYGLVRAHQAKNIAITGLGVIDGQGRAVANNFLALAAGGLIDDELKIGRVANRPHLIHFRECRNVLVKGINIRNSAFWTSTYDQCDSLHVDGVTVESRAFWNNDGIDIVDCTNSIVENSFVSSADDGICPKSHDPKKRVENLIIRNNVITSSASGIKFGTFSKGGFKNIKIVGNTVYDTFRSAIALEAVDGGMIEDIYIDSLKSLNTANPIFLVVGERYGKGSYMKNITIKNLYAEVPSTKPDYLYSYEGPTLEDEPRNPSPCVIVGLEGNSVKNVCLENIEMKFPGGGDKNYAYIGTDELGKVEELPRSYPEFSVWKELPAWGFYLRHVENITMKNVSISAAAPDYRPAVVAEDVFVGDFKGLKATAPSLKSKLYQSRCTKIRK